MKKIAVIGAGASGIVAAIHASRNCNVILIEKNEVCAKKILVTGNGKCNYWNSNQDITHYHSENMDLIKTINNEEMQKKVLNFFEKIGIVPYIKNNYYYPYSKTATAIKEALLTELKLSNVEVKNNYLVKEIKKDNDKFIIDNGFEQIIVDKVIIATGSLAYYKDDNSAIGYEIAKKFGHNIVKILPSLVQLKANEKYLKDWMGIRSDVIISLYQDNNLIKTEEGEILLTDYGISGICVFNVSSYASRLLSQNKKINVAINFAPWYKENNFKEYLDNRNNLVKNRNISELLEGFLNYKLVNVILKKVGIDKSKKWSDLSIEEKNNLASNITNFSLDITGTNSFDKAQVCSGGVRTTEIDCNTMESKLVKGLYFAGEIIDVDGDCGGYNLSFAWMTGIIAGNSAGEDSD